MLQELLQGKLGGKRDTESAPTRLHTHKREDFRIEPITAPLI